MSDLQPSLLSQSSNFITSYFTLFFLSLFKMTNIINAGDIIKVAILGGGFVKTAIPSCQIIESKVLVKFADNAHLQSESDCFLIERPRELTRRGPFMVTERDVIGSPAFSYAKGFPQALGDSGIDCTWVEFPYIHGSKSTERQSNYSDSFMRCERCKENVRWAEPNQSNGNFKCYSCRSNPFR
jgi:hypothetical protein